jgi:hypothetical protein
MEVKKSHARKKKKKNKAADRAVAKPTKHGTDDGLGR